MIRGNIYKYINIGCLRRWFGRDNADELWSTWFGRVI